MSKRRLIASLGVFGCLTIVSTVRADPIADFYSKTQMHYIVGNGAGGGYDSYVRTMARYMGKYIPGNPTHIVENMPGAGGIRAAAYIFNVAPKDGSVMGSVTSASATEPLFGNTQAKYETAKFTWIGNIDESDATCITVASSGVADFKDVLAKETIFGATGAGGATVQHVAGLVNLLGAKIKLVSGYKGMADLNLALQRGEIQAYCGIPFSELKGHRGAELQSGTLKILIQMAADKPAEIADVPSVLDFTKTEEDREVADLVFGRLVLGRPILAPPDLPADRRQALRTAFMKTMSDPDFIADMQQQKLEFSPSSGEDVERTIKRFAGYPPAVIARAKALMKED